LGVLRRNPCALALGFLRPLRPDLVHLELIDDNVLGRPLFAMDVFADGPRLQVPGDPTLLAGLAGSGQALEVAWDGYKQNRKAPRTRPAGSEFADPRYFKVN
jgi:hypothetical protein